MKCKLNYSEMWQWLLRKQGKDREEGEGDGLKWE